MIRYVAIHGGIAEKFWERWEQLSERAQIHTEVQRPKHGDRRCASGYVVGCRWQQPCGYVGSAQVFCCGLARFRGCCLRSQPRQNFLGVFKIPKIGSVVRAVAISYTHWTLAPAT